MFVPWTLDAGCCLCRGVEPGKGGGDSSGGEASYCHVTVSASKQACGEQGECS